MKTIYVASPYAGDIERNIEYAKEACRYVMNRGHVFFAPHLMYPAVLSDANPFEREKALSMGLSMMRSCSELWVFGNRISAGMQLEIDEANRLGIPIERLWTNGQTVKESMAESEASSCGIRMC